MWWKHTCIYYVVFQARHKQLTIRPRSRCWNVIAQFPFSVFDVFHGCFRSARNMDNSSTGLQNRRPRTSIFVGRNKLFIPSSNPWIRYSFKYHNQVIVLHFAIVARTLQFRHTLFHCSGLRISFNQRYWYVMEQSNARQTLRTGLILQRT